MVPVRTLLINLALSAVTIAIGVLFLEGASRVLMPVAPGSRFVDGHGEPVGLGAITPVRNSEFRQISPDYDVLAHTDDWGDRQPSVPNAPMIFVGDSFTFGLGLADNETFAAVYCSAKRIACSNISRPGSGTHVQLNHLQERLHAGWRPTEVKLFVLAMTSSLMAGNDLADTVVELSQAPLAKTPAQMSESEDAAGGLWRWLVMQRRTVLVRSNLARVIYAQLGPWLRGLAPAASNSQLEAGLEAVSGELQRLHQLSEEYGFRFQVYLIHPVQDLMRAKHRETWTALQRAAGDTEIIDTAEALLPRPSSYYYGYDGHLNAAGARRIADFLISRDGV